MKCLLTISLIIYCHSIYSAAHSSMLYKKPCEMYFFERDNQMRLLKFDLSWTGAQVKKAIALLTNNPVHTGTLAIRFDAHHDFVWQDSHTGSDINQIPRPHYLSKTGRKCPLHMARGLFIAYKA